MCYGSHIFLSYGKHRVYTIYVVYTSSSLVDICAYMEIRLVLSYSCVISGSTALEKYDLAVSPYSLLYSVTSSKKVV